MLDKPTPPEDYECCDNGCSPCVWDTYYDEMQVWQAEQTALKNSAEQTNKDDESANK
jgi:hypothetical protein